MITACTRPCSAKKAIWASASYGATRNSTPACCSACSCPASEPARTAGPARPAWRLPGQIGGRFRGICRPRAGSARRRPRCCLRPCACGRSPGSARAACSTSWISGRQGRVSGSAGQPVLPVALGLLVCLHGQAAPVKDDHGDDAAPLQQPDALHAEGYAPAQCRLGSGTGTASALRDAGRQRTCPPCPPRRAPWRRCTRPCGASSRSRRLPCRRHAGEARPSARTGRREPCPDLRPWYWLT